MLQKMRVILFLTFVGNEYKRWQIVARSAGLLFLSPITKAIRYGLGVPAMCDINSALFSVILARNGESFYNAPNIIGHE